MSQGGLLSSTTLEKKYIDEDKHHGSLSSSTHEKEKKKDDDEPGGLLSTFALEERTKRLDFSLHFSTIHFVCIESIYALVSLWYFLLSHN